MSTRVLRLMGKGVSTIQNVQFLKLAQNFGITADWNLLYGFPGETPEDYQSSLEILRALVHLAPPQGCGRIRLDRFSPNYDHAAERGFTNVRPQAYYNFIFGVDREDLGDIAYFFDYDYEDQRDPEAYTRGVRDLIAKWRAQPDSQLIYRRLSEGRAVLEDTRFTAVEPLILLTEAERVVYEICDTAHTIPNLTRRLADSGLGSDEGEVVEMLQRFCSLRIMVGDSGRYVGVAPLGDLPANEREKDRVLAIMT